MDDLEILSVGTSNLDDNWDTDVNDILNDVKELNVAEKERDVSKWPKLLNVGTKPNPLNDWDQLYNLNSQCILRNDCRKLAKDLKNKRSVPELESFLTLYCKRRNMDYVKDSGWLQILEKILVLDLPTDDEFNVFFAFTTKYIPRDTKKGSQLYDLFRLLLQYHDPQLSNFLDSMHCNPHDYASDWFSTLFSANMPTDACHQLWEIYIEIGDPFLVFHLSLVFLINAKDIIMDKSETPNRDDVLKTLRNMSSQMSVEDVPDFVQLATYYSDKTPECVRKEFHYLLFGANFDEEAGDLQVNKMLCLPIPAIDLTANDDEISSGKVNFFVVDARSNKDFDNGHFVSSFNLDCASIVDAPDKFEIALNSIESYKASRRPDDHYLFLGYGDDVQDAYMNMLIAMLMQKSKPYVSFVQGGFKKLHDCVGELKRWDLLAMHKEEKCQFCNTNRKDSNGWGFMSRMKTAFSSTSNKMKEKVESVVTPSAGMSDSLSDNALHHVDPKERHGKRYKQKSVFSIDDNSDDETVLPTVVENSKEEILLSAEFTETFECKEIFRDGEIEGHIGLTRTHVHVLHNVPGKKGYVTTEARHPLSTVLTVTSRRSIPELLTFKFGYEMNGESKITAIHKLYIPKAGECAKAVKTAIFALRPLPDIGPKGNE
ncbi:unnamed protein product [Caenorhabditis bovis]|uniref:TBC1 domain family member 23 n=1 Tax=Caenorhabditis bovis TaxID=2654633 RepID=A0A8S1EJ90_9PELO|nr:unnamed protein product [Caenorhabditis bovis]